MPPNTIIDRIRSRFDAFVPLQPNLPAFARPRSRWHPLPAKAPLTFSISKWPCLSFGN